MTSEQLEAFAFGCGTTPGQIKQVAYGRRASAELAIRIDIASGAAVTCEDIRPDVDWGYLRNSNDSNKAA
ncbi:transcriptional regulator [Halopseudomonas phragmitis]|nr:YdaS family helix-turn-helix protein [Halopseudomonas phragmitis]